MIRDVHPGLRIRILILYPSRISDTRSRIQMPKRHRITDPRPQHLIVVLVPEVKCVCITKRYGELIVTRYGTLIKNRQLSSVSTLATPMQYLCSGGPSLGQTRPGESYRTHSARLRAAGGGYRASAHLLLARSALLSES
jgi:hypothetical protein